jgi:predicted ATPase
VGQGVADGLFKRLYKGSEGNPFFTKELVRALVDSGGIIKDDSGAWNLSAEATLASDALPATIQKAVEKRIGRLPEDLRDVLSVAVGDRQQLRRARPGGPGPGARCGRRDRSAG